MDGEGMKVPHTKCRKTLVFSATIPFKLSFMRKQVIKNEQFQLNCYFSEKPIPAQNKAQIIEFIRKHIQKPFWKITEEPQGWLLVLEDQLVSGFSKIYPFEKNTDWNEQALGAYAGYLGGVQLVLIELTPATNYPELFKKAQKVKEDVENYSLFYEVVDYIVMNEETHYSFAETDIFLKD